MTRGGDEGIELLVRTFCRPGEDAVMQFPPTYGMYAVSAETNGAEVVNLVTSPDRGWLPDVAEAAKVLEERTDVKVVFACSPGNPTGTLIPVGMLRKLAEVTEGRALLVIDEAYIEFSPANTAVELRLRAFLARRHRHVEKGDRALSGPRALRRHCRSGAGARGREPHAPPRRAVRDAQVRA